MNSDKPPKKPLPKRKPRKPFDQRGQSWDRNPDVQYERYRDEKTDPHR